MKSKRVEEIKAYIRHKKQVSLDELCQVFDVSKNTIRRDVREILEEGEMKKIYGGIAYEEKKGLIPFMERNQKASEEKKRIAHKAATFIEEGDIIFVDSGTTTSHLLDELPDMRLTIITNNLELINRAVLFEKVQVIVLSGVLNKETLSFTGKSGADELERFNIHKAFMACTGFSLSSGVSNSSIEEYEIKSVAVRKSRQVFLLANGAKADVTSLQTYMPLSRVDVLITDTTLDPHYADYLESEEKTVIRV